MNYLLVGLGGAIGSMARYGLYRLIPAPWGTMGVNIIGGFLMGMLAGWIAVRSAPTDVVRVFLGMGVLGGFTTFSAFSLDTAKLMESGAWGSASTYVLGSVVASIVALLVGMHIGRALA